MVEMSVDSIRVSLVNYQRVVILKERNINRYLPIWVGPSEAEAIAIKLQNISPPRPLTHDLLYSVIKALDVQVNYVAVTELRNDTFYALVSLSTNGREITIDSRPSDAIALAVRSRAPIYVAEEVMEKAGIILDKETGKFSPPKRGFETHGKVTEEELKRLSAYKDFIQNLNLEEPGKGEPPSEEDSL